MLRKRFYTETTLTVVAAGLGVLTTFWHEWIEALTGLDPDAHNGDTEWLVVTGLFLLAAVSGLLARREYRRANAPRVST